MNKAGFIIYKDLYAPIKDLTLEEKGMFLESIFDYQITGNEPVKLPPLVLMAFKFFKNQFDIDQKKYETKCLKNKENANKRWNANASERIQTDAMDADKDKDKEKDNDIKIDWKALIGYFNQVTGKKSRTVDKKAKAQLLARLKEGYTKDDIGKAIRNCANDRHHKENNLKWLTLEFISRPNQFDKWINTIPIEQPKKSGFAWD